MSINQRTQRRISSWCLTVAAFMGTVFIIGSHTRLIPARFTVHALAAFVLIFGLALFIDIQVRKATRETSRAIRTGKRS